MRSKLILLVLLVLARARVAYADDPAPDLESGFPGVKAYACTKPTGTQRNCIECMADGKGGVACGRVVRMENLEIVVTLVLDDEDLAALATRNVTPSNGKTQATVVFPKPGAGAPPPPPPPVRPNSITVTASDATGLHRYQCWDDGKGGKACERCVLENNAEVCRPDLDASDLDRLSKQNISPTNPQQPRKATAGKFACMTFTSAIDQQARTSCIECAGGGVCLHVIRAPDGSTKAQLPLDPLDEQTLDRLGVAHGKSSTSTVESGPLLQGYFACEPKDVDGHQVRACHDSATPTDGSTGTPTTPTPSPEHPSPAGKPYKHRSRGPSFALELGMYTAADSDNIFTSGAGRVYMFGYSIFELRIESYELADRTNTYDNVANANGRAAIYSFVARPTLYTVGPIELVGTAGLQAMSRPSLRTQVDDLGGDNLKIRDQYGAGVVLGGGLRIYDVLTVDVRAYPTSWMGYNGSRAEADGAGKLVMKTITEAETPGGMPLTINAGIGLAF